MKSPKDGTQMFSSTRRTRTIVLAGLAASTVLVACSAPSPDEGDGAARTASVSIDTFRFAPEVLDITAGTEVVWHNRDDIEHTVTSGTPEEHASTFEGDLDGQGTSFSFTFARRGTYRYFCSIHEGMRGEIRVT